MTLQFQLRQTPMVPLELAGTTPDSCAGQSPAELQRASIYHGNVRCELGDFFTVTARGTGATWHFEGDCSRVHWLGSKMTAGEIIVHGSVGRHLGSAMSGGRIEVEGDAGDWAAAEMRSGQIHIRGGAGDHVASAYPGSRQGMKGGTVLVDGPLGREGGKSMRRGMLAIGGKCGDLLAVGMLAGTIVVLGAVGKRCAAAMRRGTLILNAPDPPPFLPTVRRASTGRPLILQLILRDLQRAGFSFPADLWDACYTLYHADLLEGGRGEIFVRERGSAP